MLSSDKDTRDRFDMYLKERELHESIHRERIIIHEEHATNPIDCELPHTRFEASAIDRTSPDTDTAAADEGPTVRNRRVGCGIVSLVRWAIRRSSDLAR